MDNWQILLSSTLLATFISTLVSGSFNLRALQRDYENDYFKIVLKNRVSAYEKLEALIGFFKQSVIDNDKRTYHLALANDDWFNEILKLRVTISSISVWFSDDTFEASKKLDRLLFNSPHNTEERIEFGKRYYSDIANIRHELEGLYRKDMLTLHKVKKFLKRKQISSQFEEVKKLDLK